MVRGKEKSRSKRRVFVKTPGGKVKRHYRTRKIAQPKCSECGARLHGIPKLIQSKFKNLSKTKRSSSRPYANLCSKCMRKKLISEM